MRYSLLSTTTLTSLFILAGCTANITGTSEELDDDGAGGGEFDGVGGSELGAGGAIGAGGLGSVGGLPGSGGLENSGGAPAAGGQLATGGMPGTGGSASGGGSIGGSNTGGADFGSGGMDFGVGGAPSGGAGAGGASSGGASSGGSGSGGAAELDCNAAMPTSGAQQHSGNSTGGDDNLAWEIWSNTGQGELTTYSVPAFIASWNQAGGYLGRMGFEWGCFNCSPGPYEDHGTITAQFVSRKSGTAGGYSYVGMYGWSTDPCIEWYVVDDSYGNMPINPGGTTNEGEVVIDGGTYIMYTRPTTGTGGDRCGGISNWMQYYSVRKTARACGTISLTEHFDAWKSLGMNLGDLLEAKIIVEVGGGTGNVELPVANVTTTQ